MIYNQIVTWTAFAILAMFSRTKMKVDKIIIHENFNKTDKANDIALLRLGDIT